MPGFIGFPELIVLALVLLLIFGPKRLPEIGRSVGSGIRELKSSLDGFHDKTEADPAAARAQQADRPT